MHQQPFFTQPIVVPFLVYRPAPWVELVGGLATVFAAGGIYGLVGAVGVIAGTRAIAMRRR